ncbi:MAG: hypothetical protein HeimC3_51280 [Candidatus Heimdallarchaeota archaeon LC_3]|nr:MAG: hypothetical protein HeimC3_51280 [Candidatus Heimdallarchaeota archaeon LC_3]
MSNLLRFNLFVGKFKQISAFSLVIMIFFSFAVFQTVIITDAKTQDISVEPGEISRVNIMPNLPEPFLMRDWKQVTRDYDAIFFDFNKTGEFLPLISLDSNRWNIDQDTFKMPSYVGTVVSDEAINGLAAVVSATLVGIDKSNQSGYNWVKMSENWFNNDTGQDVYLNNRHTNAGNTFWYELFPNILFYQLASFYPDTGDFQNEFHSVADRWYEASVGMGGSTDPWIVPNFDYTAYSFNTMKPIYNAKWREPDAAAAISWLEYMAYLKYQDPKYLVAAEWGLQFLDELDFNPLYEILLPYGAYIAARINAEVGTTYDISKIINWAFGPAEARSGWGVIADNWGGYDVHGLHGSITDGSGYAFAMGTFENVGALVPIVRYDDRYARAIGKYVLNAANAARLFYGNGLDSDHQDSEDWIELYDMNYSVGYEALRKSWGGISPLATGDVNRDRYLNQAGPTNLALYGSSHVGIFGGIISPTNIEKILQLDCLITDYYHKEAYPTYLYYNPYATSKTVEIDVGPEMSSLFETTTETFLVTNVTGLTSFQLSADSAAVVVIVPADGILSNNGTSTQINNITVDYETPTSTTQSTITAQSITFSTVILTLIIVRCLVYFSRKQR